MEASSNVLQVAELEAREARTGLSGFENFRDRDFDAREHLLELLAVGDVPDQGLHCVRAVDEGDQEGSERCARLAAGALCYDADVAEDDFGGAEPGAALAVDLQDADVVVVIGVDVWDVVLRDDDVVGADGQVDAVDYGGQADGLGADLLADLEDGRDAEAFEGAAFGGFNGFAVLFGGEGMVSKAVLK